ncbi:MAG: 50S ribosomal protein L9 [Betaproteobacteria bacterium]|nr:50S ribosomal protein L9 [Betaproteobacteria bacterium]
MQVILMDKVANLGNLGDVVKVRDGYARNFLIPKGMARRATPKSLAEFEARRVDLERKAQEAVSEARERAGKLEGVTVQVARKAGLDGRLFGSVTNADIAEALEAQGMAVERAAIRMPEGPLKQVGDYPITIGLHSDVLATITVSVVGE